MDWTSDAKRGQGRTGGKIELYQAIQPATAEDLLLYKNQRAWKWW